MTGTVVLATVLATAALTVGTAALVRALRRDARSIHRVRTADQVMDDARAWRADRGLETCQAIWQLTNIPQQRKETEQ